MIHVDDYSLLNEYGPSLVISDIPPYIIPHASYASHVRASYAFHVLCPIYRKSMNASNVSNVSYLYLRYIYSIFIFYL